MLKIFIQFSSVQFSGSVMSNSLLPHGLQHARLPCPSPMPTQTYVHRVEDVIQPSHPLSFPFSSCLQSFPASGSFQVSQFFTSGGQNIGASASASVLLINIQDWFPLRWTEWISLQSKGLKSFLQHCSSKAPVLSHSAFFIIQHSHPYMTTGKTIALTRRTFVGKVMWLFFNMQTRLVKLFFQGESIF